MSAHYHHFPVGGKLPLHDRLRRIASADRLGDSWRYSLDNGVKLTHEAIIHSIAGNALFAIGQEILMGRNGHRKVVRRRWSFKHGITFYQVADPRRNVASGWIAEPRMVDFTTYYQRLVQGSPPDGEPLPDLDLQFAM